MLPDHAETRPYAGGKMLAAKDDGVGLITFNQPEKRNAISMEMWTGLGDILDEFSEDSSVSVVILTGAGNKAFVSGADISQFEKNRSSADAQAEYDRANSVGRNKLINFNFNWRSMFGKPIDLSAFCTNCGNKLVQTGITGTFASSGFEGIRIGEPRVYGLRLRYRFGTY